MHVPQDIFRILNFTSKQSLTFSKRWPWPCHVFMRCSELVGLCRSANWSGRARPSNGPPNGCVGKSSTTPDRYAAAMTDRRWNEIWSNPQLNCVRGHHVHECSSASSGLVARIYEPDAADDQTGIALRNTGGDTRIRGRITQARAVIGEAGSVACLTPTPAGTCIELHSRAGASWKHRSGSAS